MGSQELLFVGMLDRQMTADDLQKHIPELLRRDVVQERVDYRTEVKESVSNGEKGDVRSEVGYRPVLLGLNSGHDPPNLVWHPTYCQSCNNQSCEQKEERARM
uniref:Uncharacterized protein n=1 Tax=Crocodylus porosus TaxID=8502 RepID=A0A7M4E680_CROPO